MSAHYEEDAQVEALRRWWGENWKALVAGLVLGLGGIFGWQMWNRHKASHEMQASGLYDNMTQAMSGKKDADVKAIAEQLTKDYDNTPYAAAASLKLAQADVSHGRFDDAAKRLQWVADHGDDAGIRAIAKLRLAAVQWQLGKADVALSQLQHPPQAYTALYEELRGDILLDQNKVADARKAYRDSLSAMPANSTERDNVKDKLENLATRPMDAS